jgi:hypothetical protein
VRDQNGWAAGCRISVESVYCIGIYDGSEGNDLFRKLIQGRFMSSFSDERYKSEAEKLFFADFEQGANRNGKDEDKIWFYIGIGTRS